MKNALIGAGGFANEVRAHMEDFKMVCFVDDEYYEENTDNIFPLSQFDPNQYQVLIAIGDSNIRQKIVNKLPKETQYITFIHPSAQILGNDVQIGEGSIVCAGSMITTNCKIGKHTHLNLHTTIGHDCIIGDYFTTAPGVHVSGNCKIEDCVYIGTNASVKQGVSIIKDTVIGLNAGVVKDIVEPGTYIGTPCYRVK